ncbi:hypothetical protein PVK06_001240 [Gossypium arboreum]|uniref:Uncharacterized protein n=1 Tax=Gossypium arboreum TaxID=29729 RepID=A0ABR0R1Q0_GOSAR|nr:hypothetical protein PVK06_001240 [Gossypium arboreum]
MRAGTANYLRLLQDDTASSPNCPLIVRLFCIHLVESGRVAGRQPEAYLGLGSVTITALRARGIEIPNFAYKFSIPESSHKLSDTSDGSFLLPLHALEVGFHLPLNPFFCHLLDDYHIALG